jgi:hypothetical protein
MNATRFPSPRGAGNVRNSNSGEHAVMTAINPRLPLPWGAATSRARRGAVAEWFGRSLAVLRGRLAVGAPGRLLELNDRMLRDVGVERIDLEYEAAYWPIWRPDSARRD